MSVHMFTQMWLIHDLRKDGQTYYNDRADGNLIGPVCEQHVDGRDLVWDVKGCDGQNKNAGTDWTGVDLPIRKK